MSKAPSKTTESWKTAITQIEPNRVAVRGYDISELMGRVSFGAAVYLILRGELPNEQVGRLMDAILVSSIDHGVTPPSTLAARTVASTGASLSASVAAGIMSINQHHGGAIENCARQLRTILKICSETGDSLESVAQTMIEETKRLGERMSGFGHRVHTADPRTKRLIELAKDAGVAGEHIEAASVVEKVFEKAGKSLPINVDGAIAAILADLEFPPEVMNGLFMIARTPGLIAHVHEESTREKPMRRIEPSSNSYDGPAARKM